MTQNAGTAEAASDDTSPSDDLREHVVAAFSAVGAAGRLQHASAKQAAAF
jgi:hypothetical protein